MQQSIERCDIPVEKYHRLIEECRLDAWDILDASQRNADPRRIKLNGFALKYGTPTKDKSIADLATLVLLFLTTGAKPYELQGLTWDRVNLDKGQLDITQAYCKGCNQVFMLSPSVAHKYVGAERMQRCSLPRSVALPEVTVYALKRLKARHTILQIKDRLRVVKGGQAHARRRLGRPPKGSNIDYELAPERWGGKFISLNRQTYCNRHEVVPVNRWGPVLSNGAGWFRLFVSSRSSDYLDYLCDTVGIPPIGLRDFQFIFAIQALKSGMSRGDVADMLGCRYESRAAIVIDEVAGSRYPKTNTDQQGPAVAAVNSSLLINERGGGR
jgi:hypothetical protein